MPNRGLVLGIILIIFASIGACSKQSPDSIESDYIDSTSELVRGEACKKLDLTKNLLELSNTKNLFKCTTWDKKFPVLYQSLDSVNLEKWNYLTSPLNERFINNKVNRDLFISIVEEMDRENGLDEFAKVISSLSDSNFFGNIDDIFKCTRDRTKCQTDIELEEEDLKNFFSFFKATKTDIDRLSSVLAKFNQLLSVTEMSFFNALSKDLEEESFKEARYHLFDKFVDKFQREDIVSEIRFLRNIFAAKNTDNRSILLEMLSKKFTKDDFKYLVEYAAIKDKDQWKEFRVINKLLKADIKCEGFIGDRAMKVDVSEHMKDFIAELFRTDKKNFLNQSIESLGILKTAQNICDSFDSYEDDVVHPISFKKEKYKLVYINAVSKTTKLLNISHYYDFFKFLQTQVPDEVVNKELFLLKFFSSDYHVSFVDFIKNSVEIDSDLMMSFYDLFVKMEEDLNDDIIYFLDWVLTKKEGELRSLGRVWNSFSRDGRLFFFNFLDSHYKGNVDVRLLFSFYSSLLNNFSTEIDEVLSLYLNHQDQFLSSLEEVTEKLGGVEIIEDYRNFFSRDHIIEIIKIISRGGVESKNESLLLSHDPYIPREQSVQVDLRNVVEETVESKCIEALSSADLDFYKMISQLPNECRGQIESNPFFKFISEVNTLGGYMYGEDYVWRNHSFFSPEMMRSGTTLLKYISENYKSIDGEGIVSVVSSLDDFISNNKRKKNLVAVFNLVNTLNPEGENNFLKAVVSFYSKNENFPYLKEFITNLNRLLYLAHKYNSGEYEQVLGPVTFEHLADYDCKNYHSLQIGSDPCPARDRIQFIQNSLLDKLTKKNDDNPTALELLIKSIHPNEGLSIPYEGTEQSIKRITIGETLSMLFDLTDTELETNKVNVEYQHIPRSVDAYFTKDWEIDSDMMDNAPDEKNVSMNTMERIETVIRDVRFDENYLGAHYMNSVAKASDYDETVASKHSLMRLCIPLKFCGKFMDRAQHRLGRNALRTFIGLGDVNNKEGWSYGDYMRSLLQIIVSSSPDNSQASTVINRRILGINISIPVLESKKHLIHHNGKILTDLSMVNVFTNAARLIRDRLGRTKQEFNRVRKGSRLNRIDTTFLKNTTFNELVLLVEKILSKARANGLITKVIDYFYDAEYVNQRLIENLGTKLALASTYVGDASVVRNSSRYKDLELTDLEPLIDWGVDNYNVLKTILPFEDNEFLVKANYFLDVVLNELESGNTAVGTLLNETMLLLVHNQGQLIGNLDYVIASQKLSLLKDGISSLNSLLKDINTYDSDRKLVAFLDNIIMSKEVDMKAFQSWLAVSSATAICYKDKCEKNTSYREVNKIVRYLLDKDSSRLFNSVNYVANDKKREFDRLLRKIFSTLTIQ